MPLQQASRDAAAAWSDACIVLRMIKFNPVLHSQSALVRPDTNNT
jgi:hypothetical protein